MLGFSNYFWITSILFTINQFLERQKVVIAFLHSYLDDFLCPGIVLGLALFIQQQFTFRNLQYRFSKGNMVFFVIWYSVLFELLFPYLDARHHADFWDIAAYTVGTIAFAFLGNKSVHRLYFFSSGS